MNPLIRIHDIRQRKSKYINEHIQTGIIPVVPGETSPILTCDEHPNLSWFTDTEDKAIEGIKNIIYNIENQFVSFLHAQ